MAKISIVKAIILDVFFFIAVIASITQILEMIIERFSSSLYNALGIYLPLIAVNCAILGCSLFMQEYHFPNLAHSTIYAAGCGIGWLLAIVAFAAIRERLKFSNIPKPLKGLGIAYITTGLMGMAFMALTGM